MWISGQVTGTSPGRVMRGSGLHHECAQPRREKKALKNQGFGWLVKALSTSLPPKNVDKACTRQALGAGEGKLGISSPV